ncbi:MAG: O-antigen ligase family protein [Armatimonadota bacterium]|nr:O-antigen ligase family protein [bacterium]
MLTKFRDRIFLDRASWTPERQEYLIKQVFVILLAGIIVGIFITRVNIYWVLALMGVLTLSLVVIWQFEAAMVLYLLVAFISWGRTPNLVAGGSGFGKGVYISQIMLGFLLAIWVGKYMLSALPANRIRSGFHIPIVLYLIYCVFNVVNAFIFWDVHVSKANQYIQVNAIEVGLRLLSAGAFVMMATSITSKKWLKLASAAVLIPGLYNLANEATGNHIHLFVPWWSILTLMPVAYMWGVALQPKYSVLKRVIALAVVLFAIVVVFVRGVSWVSGWLGLFVALATVAFIVSKRVFAFCAVAAVIAGMIAWPFINSNIVQASRTEGDFERFTLLSGALKYATHFPFGVGLGNYRSYNTFYYEKKWGTATFTSAHGTYSQHLAETGIPGLLLFSSILVLGCRWLLKEYKKLPPGGSKTFLLAAIGQLVGIACVAWIGDYIIPTYHNGGIITFSTTVYSWLIWGLAVAHVRLR